MRHGRPLWSMGFILAAHCGGPEVTHPPAPIATSMGSVGAGAVARVGRVLLAADTVAGVAAAQRVSLHRALELEIGDALFENAAYAAGYSEHLAVRAAVRGVLARARLEALRVQAIAGEIQPREVDEATARHFVELDRPETFRVVHAVLKVPEGANDGLRRRARTVAEALVARVAGAHDEADFRERAESLPDHEGVELVVESLSPVAADGRVITLSPPGPGGRYEETFARAASRLQHVGEQSGIITTSFGLHVLMLLEKLPPHVVPFSERVELLRDEIQTGRTKDARKQLLEQLRSRTVALAERHAESLMSSVELASHDRP